MANQPRPGHQDRVYASRIERLRKRLEHMGPPANKAVIAGMLDILADLVADQEEAERGE